MLLPLTGQETEPKADHAAQAFAGLETIESPAKGRTLAPNFADHNGQFILSWIERGDKRQASLRTAIWNGEKFGEARTIVDTDRMFANWADIPAVITAPSGDIYAHWLERISGDTYAYGIRIARSTDKGETWQPIGWLHGDESPTEHGFVSFIPDGKHVRAFWLDGRAMARDGGKMMLRTAELVGASIRNETIIDDNVCTCCPTSATQLATGPMVTYRDRTEKEIRDISFVQHLDEAWSKPTRVHADNWLMPGCPVNGPSLASHGEHVAVARYTVVGGKPQVIVHLTKSTELGFGRDTVIDKDNPVGRCATVCLADRVYVIYIARKSKGAALQLVELSYDGKIQSRRTLAAIASARSSGMPRMLHSKGYLWVSWTDKKQIQLGRVAIETK